MVLSALALAWVTVAFGTWAFGKRAGFYAGLCIATCFGLFLFTRILIPDVMLTAGMTLSMWAFLRAIEDEESRARWWAFLLASSLGVSLLLKSLIGVVFPLAAAYLFGDHAAIVRREHLETASSGQRNSGRSRHCRAVAHHRCAAKSSLFRSDAPQCSRRVSRLSLVLFHE